MVGEGRTGSSVFRFLVQGGVTLLFFGLTCFACANSTNSHNVTLAVDGATAYRYGVGFEAGLDVTLISVTKASGVNATTVYLYDDDGSSFLAQSNFSGDVALFDYNLSEGTGYTLMADGGGSSYTVYDAANVGWPKYSENITWTAGYAENCGYGPCFNPHAYNFVSLSVQYRLCNYPYPPPTVTIISPENDSEFSSGTTSVPFHFEVEGNYSSYACSLIVNSSLADSNNAVSDSSDTELTAINLTDDSKYEAYISCNDSVLTGNSSTQNFSINAGPYSYFVNAHNITLTLDGSATYRYGVRFEAKMNETLTSAVKATGDNATIAYLYDSTGENLLEQSNFSGNSAAFEYNLTNGTSYTLMADANGSSYIVYDAANVGWPVENDNVTWTDGYAEYCGSGPCFNAHAYTFTSLTVRGPRYLIPTTLSQYAGSATNISAFGSNVSLYCAYSYLNGTPIENASVNVVIDNYAYAPTATNGVYSYDTGTLAYGDHSWYCYADKDGFEPQNGTPIIYRVHCVSSDQCIGYQFCSWPGNGYCAGSKSDGSSCNVDDECSSNYCSNGLCCSGASTGSSCQSDSQCSQGWYCSDDYCRLPGGCCNTDSDCVAGEYCSGHMCYLSSSAIKYYTILVILAAPKNTFDNNSIIPGPSVYWNGINWYGNDSSPDPKRLQYFENVTKELESYYNQITYGRYKVTVTLAPNEENPKWYKLPSSTLGLYNDRDQEIIEAKNAASADGVDFGGYTSVIVIDPTGESYKVNDTETGWGGGMGVTRQGNFLNTPAILFNTSIVSGHYYGSYGDLEPDKTVVTLMAHEFTHQMTFTFTPTIPYLPLPCQPWLPCDLHGDNFDQSGLALMSAGPDGEPPFSPIEGFRFGISKYKPVEIQTSGTFPDPFKNELWGKAYYSVHPIEQDNQGPLCLETDFQTPSYICLEYRNKDWPKEPTAGEDKMLLAWTGDYENQRVDASGPIWNDGPPTLTCQGIFGGSTWYGLRCTEILLNQAPHPTHIIPHSGFAASILVEFAVHTNVFANATNVDSTTYSINASIIGSLSQEWQYYVQVVNALTNATVFNGTLVTDFYGQLPNFIFNDSTEDSIEEVPYFIRINGGDGWAPLTTFHVLKLDGFSRHGEFLTQNEENNATPGSGFANLSASYTGLIKIVSQFNGPVNFYDYMYKFYIESDLNISTGYQVNGIGADYVINYSNGAPSLYKYTDGDWVVRGTHVLAANASGNGLEIVTSTYDLNTSREIVIVGVTFNSNDDQLDRIPEADADPPFLKVPLERAFDFQVDKFYYIQNDSLYLNAVGFSPHQPLELNAFDSNRSLIWHGEIYADENGSIVNASLFIVPEDVIGSCTLDWRGILTRNFYVRQLVLPILGDAPQLEVLSPENDSIVNATWISGVTDPNASVYLDAVQKTISENGFFNTSVDFIHDGPNIVEVLARFENGLTNATLINFTLDTTPPFVQVLNPINSSEISGNVTINGTATDLNLNSSKINLDLNLLCSNCTSYDIDTTQLTNGNHTLRLDAWDLAGNLNETELIIDVEN